MKVAIIDSGISSGNPIFQGRVFQGYSIKKNENSFYKDPDDIEDELGHGTAIAGILNSAVPNIELIIIKIFYNGEFETDEDILYYAMEQALTEPCDIILLSLGISSMDTFNIKRFNDLCDRANSNGKVIISALDNEGSISYPACFPSVIGVDGDDSISRTDVYDIVESDGTVDFFAKSGVQRVAWTSPIYKLVTGTSFAAVHIVVQVCKKIHNNTYLSKQFVIDALRSDARRIISIPNQPYKYHSKIQSMHKVAVYPFNKEMHSIIRFSEKLPFEIIYVYDETKRGLVGRMTSSILFDKSFLDYRIRSIEEFIVATGEIDTLILGHVEEMNKKLGGDHLHSIISQCIKNNVSIYSFDKLERSEEIYSIYSDQETWHYWPDIAEQSVPKWRNGRLWQSCKPVIGIFGTSSKQGKFSLQLMMRFTLEEMGYKVGQLGTEPTAKLFGMNACYPMGYNEKLNWRNEAAVLLLNEIMHQIEMSDPDIVIVGSQSYTIPYDMLNIRNSTLKQAEFILGTRPDLMILCINPQDDLSYIKQTIQYLEALTSGKVVATVLFPVRLIQQWSGFGYKNIRLSAEEYDKCRKKFWVETELPCYALSEPSVRGLLEYIINTFL